MGAAAPRLVVLGSINMDLVARVERLPRAGETVAGRELLQIPGGKGANQAVAAARLAAATVMVGRVGDDAFGERLRKALSASSVSVEHVKVVPDCSSGVALIGVEDSGQNAITIVSGANGHLTPRDVQDVEHVIAAAEALLLQLEVPLDTVTAAAAAAQRHGVLAILDPAPAPQQGLPDPLFRVDVISPNQTEAEQLTGIPVTDPASARQAAARLLDRGAKAAVIKLGAQGAFWCVRQGACGHVPAAKVPVVDTTAAGDAFTAALALQWAQGAAPQDAVRFGCAAGTLATTRLGAQQSMPTRAEVERFLAAVGSGEAAEALPV